MMQATEARYISYYNEGAIRIGIVKALAKVARDYGSSVLLIVEAIAAGKVGAATGQAIDNFVNTSGVPRETVLDLLYDTMGKSEAVTLALLVTLCEAYGPGMPTDDQAYEIALIARRLKARAKTHWRQVEEAKELVRAAGGEIDVIEPE